VRIVVIDSDEAACLRWARIDVDWSLDCLCICRDGQSSAFDMGHGSTFHDPIRSDPLDRDATGRARSRTVRKFRNAQRSPRSSRVDGPLKSRGREPIDLPERSGEVTVTSEPQVKRQASQVVVLTE
jgi:hypothetical protein